jgi:hypothetical protein
MKKLMGVLSLVLFSAGLYSPVMAEPKEKKEKQEKKAKPATLSEADADKLADETLALIKGMIEAIKANKDDCKKAAKALEDWTAKNKTKLTKLTRKSKTIAAKMSKEEKKKHEERMKAKFMPMMNEMMSTMMEFSSKCSTEAAMLGRIMSDMK